jgi:hypothetical protein
MFSYFGVLLMSHAAWRMGCAQKLRPYDMIPPEEAIMQIRCDIVQECEVPSGIPAIRIEAQAAFGGRASRSAVTLQIPPGAVLRLRLVCLPAEEPFEPLRLRDSQSPERSDK